MRKFLLILVSLLVLLPVTSVSAAPPPDGAPGLQKAIEAKDRHVNDIFSIPGVAAVGVGLGENGEAAIIILTEHAGVRGLPGSIDGVPALVRVSGEFIAMAPPPGKGGGNGNGKGGSKKNQAPVVSISSPADNGQYPSGATIDFIGSATDDKDGDLSSQLVWSVDGAYLFTGSSSSAVLGDGSHTIVASVTDSGGKTGSASVQITVGEAPPPPPSDYWEPRPVPIGVSTGHPDITAGTIGARVKDNGGNVFALSNNHVYANQNQASIGDNVLQPGVYDGGRNPEDAIGTLYNYVPIVFSRFANNTVDAAIAISNTSLLGNSTPADVPNGYGTPSSTTATAVLNMYVQKVGRTTLWTEGNVYMVHVSVDVRYDVGIAHFVDQIVITPGTFSAGGDSGSLIVDATNHPVGLLFAGSSSYTIANPIDSVLSALGVSIDGAP